ncbi:MAG: glycosyl hydrolase 53 family protein, partial [Saccharofermentanales bacterium]
EYPEISVSKPWHELTIDEMVPILEKYGDVVAEELLATGVKVNVWDVGNEVNFGVAGVAVKPLPKAIDNEMGENWYRPPDKVNPEIGNLDVYSCLIMETDILVGWMETNLWPYQARLMNAVKTGILKADRGAKFSTHVTYAENTIFTTAFFKAMIENGFAPDVAGVSYYPSSLVDTKGRLTDFKSTVRCLYHEMGLPVFIAEYAYPDYSAGTVADGPYKDWNNKVGNYEMDISGQAAFLHDLASWGSLNGICGIRPWAPELLVLWKEFSMFSLTGSTAKALPVIDSISTGLKNPSTEVLYE